MKKFLLTVALILAVVTSLTAGTLAAYNQTLSITGNVQAPHFDFTAAGSSELRENVKINPGQTKYYQVDITNNSEVPVEFTAAAALSGELATALSGRLSVTVLDGDKKSWDGKTTLDPDETATAYVKVTWADGDDATDVAAGKADSSASLSISVNGTYADTDDQEAGTVDQQFT